MGPFAIRGLRPKTLVLCLGVLASLGFTCAGSPKILLPIAGQVSAVGEIAVRIQLDAGANPAAVQVLLDDGSVESDVTAELQVLGRLVRGNLDVPAAGDYVLRVRDNTIGLMMQNTASFSVIAPQPDGCEVLNALECLLPYPSNEFRALDASAPGGYRLDFPQAGFPDILGDPIDPSLWSRVDGFSPTAPILMHFPAEVDLLASGADVQIQPDLGAPQTRPYAGVRTQSGSSLDAGSPTVILNARTGERVMHWVELDARADPSSGRQAMILRPAVALEPSETYIVAVRGLVDAQGDSIAPEAPFRALRDGAPTTIPAIESRRIRFEQRIFLPLERAQQPVAREDLQLAFEFTVQSDETLTAAVRSMLSQSYAWVEEQIDDLGRQTFTVAAFGAGENDSIQNDCSVPGTNIWRVLRGTYEVPLFLTEDLADVNTLGVLNVDENGVPVQNGATNVKYTISIPCVARNAGVPAQEGVLLGHGLFGTGDGIVLQFGGGLGENFVTGGTDWRGLASPDALWVALNIIGTGASGNRFNNFPAFVDRLKQGQINTQVLARMMKRGDFNVDPAFAVAPGVGAFPGPDAELYYFGASLGGIMGTFFATLTEDVERFNIDVPAMNFAMLLQRSTQFILFEALLEQVGLDDPLLQLLNVSLQHELWVAAEPAGYIHRLKPQLGPEGKKILMTVAWLDKQVSNQATEVLARSLELPQLEGSVMSDVVGIPDVTGPVDSAVVLYDQGSFDIYDAAQLAANVIPPLANQIPSDVCDPHPIRALIPASQEQLLEFFRPTGTIQNFCDGICDGATANERPSGDSACDPLAP